MVIYKYIDNDDDDEVSYYYFYVVIIEVSVVVEFVVGYEVVVCFIFFIYGCFFLNEKKNLKLVKLVGS